MVWHVASGFSGFNFTKFCEDAALNESEQTFLAEKNAGVNSLFSLTEQDLPSAWTLGRKLHVLGALAGKHCSRLLLAPQLISFVWLIAQRHHSKDLLRLPVSCCGSLCSCFCSLQC